MRAPPPTGRPDLRARSAASRLRPFYPERSSAPAGLELRLLGRALERERRALAAADRLDDQVEVAGADLALVARGGVALLLHRELALLQLDVRGHALLGVCAGELVHRCVQRVEAGERDELELVADFSKLPLEACNLVVVEVLAPVERRRAVVREQLARELLPDRLGELARLAHVRRRRLAPEQVGVRRVRETAGDRGLDAVVDAEEALGRPLTRAERAVRVVDVARDQVRAERVRPGDQHRRYVEHVRREPRRVERADELAGRDEHLAAEVAALLLRGELVLEVN